MSDVAVRLNSWQEVMYRPVKNIAYGLWCSPCAILYLGSFMAAYPKKTAGVFLCTFCAEVFSQVMFEDSPTVVKLSSLCIYLFTLIVLGTMSLIYSEVTLDRFERNIKWLLQRP